MEITAATPYSLEAFIAILIFTAVHLSSGRIAAMSYKSCSQLFSIGGGIAIAYVFIDLLPKLCKNDLVVRESFQGLVPFAERHVYIMALCGFLLFFLVDRSQKTAWRSTAFCLSLSSYAIFNFFVGYAVAYKNDPDIQPLALFTIAIALHYLTNDYTLNKEHGETYRIYGKWLLIAALFAGWITGSEIVISPAAIALINAFISGGVIMNVIRHELPSENPNSSKGFILGAFFYTMILLEITPS